MSITRVASNKPVAVFCGNARTQNVQTNGDGDHALAQMTPVNTWGTQFGLVQSIQRTTRHDTFRIITPLPVTTVSYLTPTGLTSFTINAALGSREVALRSLSSVPITASQPMFVVQLAYTVPARFSTVARYANSRGDVGMNVVTPVKQYLKQYSITTPEDSRTCSYSAASVVQSRVYSRLAYSFGFIFSAYF